MSRPCLPTRASCEANLFNDLVKSLVLKWGRRDAGFHHIFLKQRPPCNSPRKLSENKCLLHLSVIFFRVFDAWKPLMLHQHIQIRPWASQIQAHPTAAVTTTTVLAAEFDFFQLSNSAGGVFISWITESWMKKENFRKSEGGDHPAKKSSFTWMDRFREQLHALWEEL